MKFLIIVICSLKAPQQQSNVARRLNDLPLSSYNTRLTITLQLFLMISFAHVIAKSVTTADNSRPDIVFVLLPHDKIHLIWNTTFRLLTASLLQAMGSTGCGTALCIMVVCCNWCISIRLLFQCTMISSGLRWFFVRRWFRCFLIVGIHVHASSISGPLSLFILFGLSIM